MEPYLVSANFPLEEPMFYLPDAPIFTKVPEPRVRERPPQYGYDMKTLRKQIEFLHNEIEERTETQALLYRQNEELWSYAQTLVQSNKANVHIMRSQVHNLHEELRQIYEERQELAKRLQLAKSSEEMIKSISGEISSLKIANDEAETIRKLAESELLRAQREKSSVDEDLQTQREKLRVSHLALDEHRWMLREEENEFKADKFFWTNEVVLRSAYGRFRKAVARSIRLSRLKGALQDIYRSSLRTGAWQLWRNFVIRRRVMHDNDGRRLAELKCCCFARWKVLAASEAYFRKARRKHLLKMGFDKWMQARCELKWECSSAFKISYFQQKQQKRVIFNAWRSSVIFLEWESPQLRLEEVVAVKHFVRQLLYSWSDASRGAELELKKREAAVRRRRLFRPLVAWKSLCRIIWRRRGSLLKSFFSRCRGLVQGSERRHSSQARSVTFWMNRRKIAVLRRWAGRTRSMKRAEASQLLTQHIALRRHRRHLRSALVLWAQRVFTDKRLRMCSQATRAHICLGKLRDVFATWRDAAVHRQANRAQKTRKVLTTFFHGWKRLVPLQKREAKIARSLKLFLDDRCRAAKVFSFARWRDYFRRNRRMARLSKYLTEKSTRTHLRRDFMIWKCKFSRQLLWRTRELQIDQSRLSALHDLRLREYEDLERENEKMAKLTDELEQSLIHLQEVQGNKETEIVRLRMELEERTRERSEAESQLEKTQHNLQSLTEERDRLREIEEMIAKDRKKEEELMTQRKLETERIMQNLQEQSDDLRAELQEAREQAFVMDRFGEESVEREQRKLEETLRAAHAVEMVVQQRRSTVRTLEDEQETLRNQLRNVQERLSTIQKDGEEMLEEGKSRVRKRAAEAQVLKSENDLTEARVEELKRLLREEQAALGRMRREEIEEEESRELDSLQRDVAAVSQRSRDFFASQSTHRPINLPLTLFLDSDLASGYPPPYLNAQELLSSSSSASSNISSLQSTPVLGPLSASKTNAFNQTHELLSDVRENVLPDPEEGVKTVPSPFERSLLSSNRSYGLRNDRSVTFTELGQFNATPRPEDLLEAVSISSSSVSAEARNPSREAREFTRNHLTSQSKALQKTAKHESSPAENWLVDSDSDEDASRRLQRQGIDQSVLERGEAVSRSRTDRSGASLIRGVKGREEPGSSSTTSPNHGSMTGRVPVARSSSSTQYDRVKSSIKALHEIQHAWK